MAEKAPSTTKEAPPRAPARQAKAVAPMHPLATSNRARMVMLEATRDGGELERDSDDALSAAAGALEEADRPLPHAATIQRSFGGHDLSNVRATVGGAAAEVATALGARAFTLGDRIGFREEPDLRLAAHEAAHTVQQSGAVELEGGRSAYEHHANVVAATVVAGGSSSSLLSARGAGAAAPALQLDDSPDLDIYPFTDIEDLPDREYFENRGDLTPKGMPRGWNPNNALISIDGGGFGFDMPSEQERQLALPTLGHPNPIPETFARDTTEMMTIEQMVMRLSAMELVIERIGKYPLDTYPYIDTVLGVWPSIARTRIQDVVRGQLGATPLLFKLPPLGPVDRETSIPTDVLQLTQEVLRTEHVLDRVAEGIVEINADLQREAIEARAYIHGGTDRDGPNYDRSSAVTNLAYVRRLYYETLQYVLVPKAVPFFNYADSEHGRVGQENIQRKIDFLKDLMPRTDGRAVEQTKTINEWASMLDSDLRWLEEEAPKVREARERNDPDLSSREGQFIDRAQLVATSLEVLADWLPLLQSYEALRGNSGMTGFTDALVLQMRFEKMYRAAQDRDVDYLKALLAHHRADPKVIAFYNRVPSIIRWSQFVISLVITLIAAVVSAGVGMAVMAIAGVTQATIVTFSWTFLIRTGLQAIAFTMISRVLSSQFAGMAPTSKWWHDLIWNFGLFGIMGAAANALRSTMKLLDAFSRFAVTTMVDFEILQVYGIVRFRVERGEWPSHDEVSRMTVDNALMMGGLMIGMKAFAPMLKPLADAAALKEFRNEYGGRFAEFETARSELIRDAKERLKNNPEATEADLADLVERAKNLDMALDGLVKEAVNSGKIDPRVLRQQVADLFGRLQEMPLPEVLQSAGLATDFDITPMGGEGGWSFPKGRGDALMTFLRGQGYEIIGDLVTPGGRVIEAVVPGKGRVTFVERPTTERVVVGFSEVEIATARAKVEAEIRGDDPVGGTRGTGGYELAKQPVQTPDSVAKTTADLAKGLAKEGIHLGEVQVDGKQVKATLEVELPGTDGQPPKRVPVSVVIESPAYLTPDPLSSHGQEAGHARYELGGSSKDGWHLYIEVDAKLADARDLAHNLRHELREAGRIVKRATLDPSADIGRQQRPGVFGPGAETEVTDHAAAAALELADLFGELRPALEAPQKVTPRTKVTTAEQIRAEARRARRRLDATLQTMGFAEPTTRAAKTKALLDYLGIAADSPLGRYVESFGKRLEGNVLREAALARLTSGERATVMKELGPALEEHVRKHVPAEAIDALNQALRANQGKDAATILRYHEAGLISDTMLPEVLRDLSNAPVAKGRHRAAPPGFEFPTAPKPKRGTPEGTAWRYQRYKHQWWHRKSPRPGLATAEEWASAKFGGTRAGGERQVAVRKHLVEVEGYTNTETEQLGTREEDGKTVRNMVDMYKDGAAEGGGRRWVEVDPMNNDGTPNARIRPKLEAELMALQPGEELMFVDSNNQARRIVYKFGDAVDAGDRSQAKPLPRKKPARAKKQQ